MRTCIAKFIFNLMHIKSFLFSFFSKLKKLIFKNTKLEANKSLILDKSCKFVVNECIIGDYYEFGVWRGQTFVYAYKSLIKAARKRLEASSYIGYNPKAEKKRKQILDNTLFHAFDSFKGLPELIDEDKYSDDFAAGQFKADESSLLNLARDSAMPKEKIRIHKGWFEDTCNYEYFKKNKLNKASIIWLDCDLYSSATNCFEIIKYLVQDGTVLIIDDWFSGKGSPFHGVQKAFYDWSSKGDISQKWHFTEYQRESWKRISFIVNKI